MTIGFLWGAPVFTYVLMVSAIARRSPFLLLVVPLLVLTILEGMLFSSSYLIGFFSEHLPSHRAGLGRDIYSTGDLVS